MPDSNTMTGLEYALYAHARINTLIKIQNFRITDHEMLYLYREVVLTYQHSSKGRSIFHNLVKVVVQIATLLSLFHFREVDIRSRVIRISAAIRTTKIYYPSSPITNSIAAPA